MSLKLNATTISFLMRMAEIRLQGFTWHADMNVQHWWAVRDFVLGKTMTKYRCTLCGRKDFLEGVSWMNHFAWNRTRGMHKGAEIPQGIIKEWQRQTVETDVGVQPHILAALEA